MPSMIQNNAQNILLCSISSLLQICCLSFIFTELLQSCNLIHYSLACYSSMTRYDTHRSIYTRSSVKVKLHHQQHRPHWKADREPHTIYENVFSKNIRELQNHTIVISSRIIDEVKQTFFLSRAHNVNFFLSSSLPLNYPEAIFNFVCGSRAQNFPSSTEHFSKRFNSF